MNNDEKRKIIEGIFPFWNGLDSNEQNNFLNNTSITDYKRGDSLHSPANDCVGLLAVCSGELRAYILSPDGREVTLYRLSSGGLCILSASCVLKTINFDVYIDAEKDSRILILAPSYYDQLAKKNLAVENFGLKLVSQRFSDVMWSMEQILFLSFDKRLATFLLAEAEKSKSDEIKLTHEQIAKYMGSAREVVSRMLKYFETEGFVTLMRGGVRIVNKKALRELV